MTRDYIERRGTMFSRASGNQLSAHTGVASRITIGVKVDPGRTRYETSSPGVRGMNGFILLQNSLKMGAEIARGEAEGEIIRSVREQLAPGQEVEVFLSGFNYGEGYETVALGYPKGAAYRDRSNTKMVPVRSDKPAPPSGPPAPPKMDFVIPKDGGTTIISLPAAVNRPERSPVEARPGRGEMKEWFDRWDKNPGLIDLDFDRKDKKDDIA